MRSHSVALRAASEPTIGASVDPWLGSSKDIVQRFVDVLLVTQDFSLCTCADYRSHLLNLDRWLQRCEGCTLVTADDGQLIRYLTDWVGRHTSVRKLPRVLLSLRRFYAFLCDSHVRDDDPMLSPSISEWDAQQRPRSMTLRRQRESARAVQQRDRVMLALMLAAGLKPAQLISLELHDLRLDQGSILVGGQPDASEIHVSSEMIEMLQQFLLAPRQTLLQGRKSTHVFPACGGSKLTAQDFWHAFRRRAEGARAPMRNVFNAELRGDRA